MANFTPRLIVNNSSPSLGVVGLAGFEYTKGAWTTVDNPAPIFYDSTITQFNAFNHTTLNTGLNLTFSGVSATVFGFFSCLPDFTLCPYKATLDNNTSETLTPSSSTIFYQGSGFSDGPHLLQIEFEWNQTGVEVDMDYALVQPGADTELNYDLYVDHNSTDVIEYTGNWKTSADGSTRDSITPGDKLWFPFYGDDIAVLGYLHQQDTSGNLSFSVSVDDRTPLPVSIAVNSSEPDMTFYEYFSAQLASSSSEPVNHTVAIEIQEISGTQTFSFSAFQFRPNFKTLGTMPSLPERPTQGSADNTSTTTTSSQTSPTNSSLSDGPSSTHVDHTKTIVGAVVGSLGGILLVALLLFFVNKRRRLRKANAPVQYDPEFIAPSMETYRDRPVLRTNISQQHLSQGETSTLTPFTKRYHRPEINEYPEPTSSILGPTLEGSLSPKLGPTTSVDNIHPALPAQSHNLPEQEEMLPPPPMSEGFSEPGERDETDTLAQSQSPGTGRFPTRRRMMEMIERLNYQVQALSQNHEPDPPAYS